MGFGDQIKAFGVEAIAKTDEKRRTITTSLLNGVISDTPVLTGRLRGNWQTTENSPASNTIARDDKSGEQAKAEMVGVVLGTKNRDCVLYLSNNLPYAYPIEFEGYSKKAPAGMIRRNIARINSIVAKVNSA